LLERSQKIRLGFNPADQGPFHHNLPSAYSNPNAIRRTVLPGGRGSRGVDPLLYLGGFQIGQ
jgi:hypothetical protein